MSISDRQANIDSLRKAAAEAMDRLADAIIDACPGDQRDNRTMRVDDDGIMRDPRRPAGGDLSTARLEAFAAEAERQYPALNPDDDDLTYPRSAVRSFSRGAFILGAEWANAQHEAEVLRLRRGIEDEIQLTQEAGRTLQVLRLRALLDGPCDE